MKAAYADPPYLGMGKKKYGHLHPEAHVWDTEQAHIDLIEQLEQDYDAWAVSLHVPSLPFYLSICPKNVRVAAWVKPFCSFKPNVKRAWSWEPVIFKFNPDRTPVNIWRDHIQANISLKQDVPGAKPDAFCVWLFEGLALDFDDQFDDLFPGSGAVQKCWDLWSTPIKQYALQTQD